MTHASRSFLIAGLVIFVALGLVSGCISSQPGSTSTAHAVMEYATPEQIHDELVRVFEDEQYVLDYDDLNRLIFTRPATQRDVVMYGEFLSGEIIMNVEVTVKPYRRDSHLVLADVFVHMNRERDKKVGMIGSRPYQALLNRVKANLVSSSKDN